MNMLKFMAAGAILMSSTAASGAGGIGEAMAVIDAARASGQVGERTLAVGSKVFVGDLVATDSIGEAQLLFSDGTRMVVGANSSLVIDKFLFRGDAAENKFSVRALGGAFRFISGHSGDDGYSIRTPTATIGVRGTAFDFVVSPSGETKLVLLQGTAELCDNAGSCATAIFACDVALATSAGAPAIVTKRREQVQQVQGSFPFQMSQNNLLPDFRTAGADCASADTVTNAILRDLPSETQNNPSPN